mgnify:FL=1
MSTCVKYTITNTSGLIPLLVSWRNCNGQPVSQTLRARGTKTVCAINNSVTVNIKQNGIVNRVCTCNNVAVTNTSGFNNIYQYVDCGGKNRTINILAGQTVSICMCSDCLGGSVDNLNFKTQVGQRCVDFIPVTPTPTRTPTQTPTPLPCSYGRTDDSGNWFYIDCCGNLVTGITVNTLVCFNPNFANAGIFPQYSACTTVCVTPTPSPSSVTPTPTPTVTSSPTLTPTNTTTPTPTPTETEPGVTSTPTPTPTESSTPTPTPTESSTPTPTPSSGVINVVNMTLLEVGGDVVLSGSGTLDTTSLGTPTLYYRGSSIVPTGSQFGCGVPGPGPFNCYIFTGGTVSSPANFGTGGQTIGSSATGDFFGIGFNGVSKNLFIPTGYTSGSFISGTTTFDFTDLATLGATVGTYTWSWGSGGNASSIVLQVGVPATPTPTPTNTSTPTPTPSPVVYSYSLASGNTQNEACSGVTNITVYSSSSSLVASSQLYEDSSLTIPTTAPWYSNNVDSYQMAGNVIGTIVVCV